MHNVNDVEHPVLVQRLADALMHWPLASAVASVGIAVGLTGALGWAAVGGLIKLVG